MATNLGKESILNQINVITFSRYFHHVVFSNMAFKNEDIDIHFLLCNVRIHFSPR